MITVILTNLDRYVQASTLLHAAKLPYTIVRQD